MDRSLSGRRRYRSWPEEASVTSLPVDPAPVIEIDLAGGYRIRVGEGVLSATLRQVLDVLEQR